MAQAMGTRWTGRAAPERGVTLCHTMFATSGAELALRPVPGLRSSNARFPTAYAVGYYLCAEHVRQLEGESPFHNLMEVK